MNKFGLILGGSGYLMAKQESHQLLDLNHRKHLATKFKSKCKEKFDFQWKMRWTGTVMKQLRAITRGSPRGDARVYGDWDFLTKNQSGGLLREHFWDQ